MRRRLSLYIEGHKVDLQDDGLVLWNWQHSDLYNPAAIKNSYSQDVTIPGTKRNDDIFGGIFRADRRLQRANAAPEVAVEQTMLRTAALRSGMLRASSTYTTPVTATSNGFVTGENVGNVAIDAAVSPTEVTTIAAQVRPGMNCESGTAMTSASVYSSARSLVLFIQAVGYDADGTAIAATPTLVAAHFWNRVTTDVQAIATGAGYTPSPLNTTLVEQQAYEDYTSANRDPEFWMADTEAAPAYYDLSLTATGLQRIEVRLLAKTVTLSDVTGTVTFVSADYPRLFAGLGGMEVDKWAVEFGTTSGETDTDPDPDPPTPPDPPDPPGPEPPDPPEPPTPTPDPEIPTGNYRTTFDPSKRADFAIYDEAGQIVVAGYCRLARVIEHRGVHTYSLALFGGLGGFIYEMSYNADGTKKSLADLDYGTELDFVIDKNAVADAWARLAGDTSKPAKWDVINFAPCYNGIPENFSADKAVAIPGDMGLTVPDGYSTKGGYVLVNLAGDRDEWEVWDLRSYLQRPVVSMRAILAAIAESSSWDVDYSDVDAFLDLWLTRPLLPSLGTFKQSSGGIVATFTSLGEVTGNILADIQLADVPAGAMVKTNVAFTLAYDVPGVTGNGLKTIGPVSGSGIRSEQVLFCQLIGMSNGVKTAAGPVLAIYDSADTISAAAMVAACGFQPDSLNTEVTAQRDHDYRRGTGDIFERTREISLSIEAENLDEVMLQVTAYHVAVLHGSVIDRFAYGAAYAAVYDSEGNYFVPSGAIATGSASCTFESTDSLRSGATITKEMLLSTSKTPAEYLVSLCKMFGFYIFTDPTEKRVEIMRRETFFQRETVDLTERVNRLHDIQLDPLAFSSKWYEFKGESVGGRFEEEYRQVQGVQYGVQRVDTGYDFDAQTYDILAGSAFRQAAAVQARSKYFNIMTTQGGVWRPSVFQAPGNTFTVWNGEGATEDVPINLPGNMNADPLNPTWPGYDITHRAEFRDGENKPVDGSDVLLYYRGSPLQYAFHLSDDLPVMDTVNGGPCWILDASPGGLELPSFSRYHTIRPLGATRSDVLEALDFGIPREVDIPGLDYTAGTIYLERWRKFLVDRLDVDNKVLRCRVDFRGLRVSGELLRKFYWYRNSLWVLNKITNYSLTTFDPAECEFIQVRSIDNYTT